MDWEGKHGYGLILEGEFRGEKGEGKGLRDGDPKKGDGKGRM